VLLELAARDSEATIRSTAAFVSGASSDDARVSVVAVLGDLLRSAWGVMTRIR
jgi:hypothetical protein